MAARLSEPLGRLAGAAPVILRVVIGVVMAAHGLQKLGRGPGAVGQGFASMGLPLGTLLGPIVTFLELGGGLLLIVGLLTRVWGLLIGLLMIGTTLVAKLDAGLIGTEGAGAELDLVIMAGAFAIALLGPGRPSADHALGIERTEISQEPRGRVATAG